MDRFIEHLRFDSIAEILKKRYMHVLFIWFSMIILYFALDGGVENAPKRLLIISGALFSAMMLVPGKYHNRVFISIILSGSLFVYITPVMDIPDENAHYSRALYLSDGNLYVPEKIEQSKVADDIMDVEAVFKQPLVLTDLEKEKVAETKVKYPGMMHTNGYAFISYLPQATGILIARLFDLSISASIILGRFFNLLVYALLVRLALKKSNSNKYVLGTVALLPMSVYIAASFNQDAMSNGLIFLIIGLFCEFVEKEQITDIDLFLFALLSLALATMKFPYVLIVGLLLFLPINKLNLRKYMVIFISIGVTLILGIVWLKIASSINLQLVAENPEINPTKKIVYTLQNIGGFLQLVLKELFYLIPNKLQGAFTFGWFTYGLDLTWLYIAYLSCIFIMLPRKKIFSNWNKVGIILVSLAITMGILLTAYLMWNPVTDMSFAGVQGRYFIGIFVLLGLVSNIFYESNNRITVETEKIENTLLLCANFFVLALIIRTFIEYYQF
ncbi:DUF2142 domain-containing protein [Streptococcus suis]|uniref:DUF2142 domain-containing protein n=1 Tax=Streptococcus suis TaxID=1307 RepID=UPI00196069D9|nr:DUF2142 domain-containing protein [Streptococcus suis]MBM7180659.1 DUF2142 domain-containing protein [Streptococcus suis]